MDPCSVAAGMPIGLDGMGLVKAVNVWDGNVHIEIRLTSPSCYMLGYFIDEIDQLIRPLDGVTDVEVTFDHGMEWEPEMIRADVRRRREELFRRRAARIVARRPARSGGGARDPND
jgi:metal-sulfur cluster biosynthetic enzyme